MFVFALFTKLFLNRVAGMGANEFQQRSQSFSFSIVCLQGHSHLFKYRPQADSSLSPDCPKKPLLANTPLTREQSCLFVIRCHVTRALFLLGTVNIAVMVFTSHSEYSFSLPCEVKFDSVSSPRV